MPDLRIPTRQAIFGSAAPSLRRPAVLAMLLLAMPCLMLQSQERRAANDRPTAPVRVAQTPRAETLPAPVDVHSGEGPVVGTPAATTESRREVIPLLGLNPTEQIEITSAGGRISLFVRDAPLNRVLELLAHRQDVNIVASEDVTGRVSITLRNVSLENTLSAVLGVAGFTWVENEGIILVTRMSGGSALDPRVQGRKLRIFELDFTSAEELEPVVRGMLSPVGKAFVNVSNPTDNRRTKEVLTVEDLPSYLDRIGDYIAQLDQAPRQVLIEARVLSVELSDENKHGVNWNMFTEIAGAEIGFHSTGFATPMVGNTAPATYAVFNTGNFNTLLECLKTTTDAKTLAAPKVLVVNGQEARMQVGEQLGFRVTTTTETSTLENVNFLDVGVVLRVVPRITADGRVIMHVKPEVSSGEVNGVTGLPEEETTEIETTVMLCDGQGVVIGGLIQEKIIDTQNKNPWLGDKWVIGRMFQKRQFDKARTEIIIALIPHIVCVDGRSPRPIERIETERAFTPIVQGPLDRFPRPWEPSLYDAIDNPMPRGEYLQRIPPPPGPITSYDGDACVPAPAVALPPGAEVRRPAPQQREFREFYVEPIAPGQVEQLPPQSRRLPPDARLSLLPPVEGSPSPSRNLRWSEVPRPLQR